MFLGIPCVFFVGYTVHFPCMTHLLLFVCWTPLLKNPDCVANIITIRANLR